MKIADMCEKVRPLPPKVLYAPKIENSAQQLKDLVYGRKMCIRDSRCDVL